MIQNLVIAAATAAISAAVTTIAKEIIEER